MSSVLNITASVAPSIVDSQVAQVAHGFSVGSIIRRDSGGSYVGAQADSLGNSLAVGMVTGIQNADGFKFAQGGLVQGLSGLVDGTQYYLDPASAGGYTATKPTTVGQFVKPLFVAVGTTAALLNIGDSEEIEAPAGGGGNGVVIEAKDVTNVAEMAFTTGIDSTYDYYILRLIYVIPTAAGSNLRLLTSTDGGATYVSNAYRYVIKEVTTAPSDTNDNNAGAAPEILLGSSVGATPAAGEEGVCGHLEIFEPSKATTYKHINLDLSFVNTSSNFVHRNGLGYVANNAALNAFKLIYSAGNITGKAVLLGYKNS